MALRWGPSREKYYLSLWSERIGTKQDFLCLDCYYSNIFQKSVYFAKQSIPVRTWLIVRGMHTSSNVSTLSVVPSNIPANNSSLCICVHILIEQTPQSIHGLLQQRQIMIECQFSPE
jgi:hypothetical protein